MSISSPLHPLFIPPSSPLAARPPIPPMGVNTPSGVTHAQKKVSAARAAGAHAPFVGDFHFNDKSARHAPAGRKAEDNCCDLVPMPGEKEGGLARGSSFTFSAEAVRHG